MQKLISWNVNGLRACMTKGFREAFDLLDADVFCIQETKLQEGQIAFSPDGYYCFWNYAEKKGYSGTALFTKEEPLSVRYGIGIEEHSHEGRIITAEYTDRFIVVSYTPNSQDSLKRIDYRLRYEDDLRAYLSSLAEKKSVILCGDLNVAHEEIDLKNPNTNHENPGFSDAERQKMTELLQAGFTDSFRYFYPDTTGAYSWWSYRMRARERNTGWRIDYFIVSDDMKSRLVSAGIHSEIYGSDHCPVELVIQSS